MDFDDLPPSRCVSRRLGGSLDGSAAAVAQNQDQLRLQGRSAELQAAQDAALCMGTWVGKSC